MDEVESVEDIQRTERALEHQESLTPTGFRHLTNVSVSAEKVTVNESWIPGRQAREERTFHEYISDLRRRFGDAQLTEAYSRYGEQLGSPWNLWYAVYVPL